MKIYNENKTRIIEIVKIGEEKEYYPSVEVDIRIKTEELSATLKRSIWIAEKDIESFIEGLTKLDENRVGEISLESMSPEELKITFKNKDKLGHLWVTLQVEKKYREFHDYSDSINIGYEIDPSILPYLATDLKKMKQ